MSRPKWFGRMAAVAYALTLSLNAQSFASTAASEAEHLSDLADDRAKASAQFNNRQISQSETALFIRSDLHGVEAARLVLLHPSREG